MNTTKTELLEEIKQCRYCTTNNNKCVNCGKYWGYGSQENDEIAEFLFNIRTRSISVEDGVERFKKHIKNQILKQTNNNTTKG